MKTDTWIGGYRGELSYGSPKVPFCIAFGARLFRMTHLNVHNNLFLKTRLSPVLRAYLTLLKLNYLQLITLALSGV